MALLEVTTEQIVALIRQLPAISKRTIFDVLRQEFESSNNSDEVALMDTDTQAWLDADLTESLPAYEWGPTGTPEGLPVQYAPGKGMMILEANES